VISSVQAQDTKNFRALLVTETWPGQIRSGQAGGVRQMGVEAEKS